MIYSMIKTDLETTHMIVTKLNNPNGYLGVGIEYPGIILSTKTKKGLEKMFKECIPSYKRALKKYNIRDPPSSLITIGVD